MNYPFRVLIPQGGGEVGSVISAGSTYVHVQSGSSSLWSISHGLGRRPSVTSVELSGMEIKGTIDYIDNNTLTITFNVAITGEAYLN